MARIPLYGTLQAQQKDGRAVHTSQTWDSEQREFQSVINKTLLQTVAALGSTDEKTQEKLDVIILGIEDLKKRVSVQEQLQDLDEWDEL